MVQGIEKFREYFREYTGQYVIIGGTACDIILSNEGVPFRQTKDIDMVLIIEAIEELFIKRFIEFVSDGGYAHIKKGTDANQFYRFEKPVNEQFPYMIELFSRRPDYLKRLDSRLAPIHVCNDTVSLSAILLDDEYYSLLVKGTVQIEDISVLSLETLILLKIKAWLDLSERRHQGEQIDSKNIRKHKNDIIRLSANIHPSMVIEVDEQIKKDVNHFIEIIGQEKIDMKNLGIKAVTYTEVLEKISTVYQIS